MERIIFSNDGTELVGNLYMPQDVSNPAPAVVLLGPMTFVKEQAPTEYAKRLADQGFVALAFDPRYRGESGGEPRNYESPLAKVADVRAAIDYLVLRPEVDADRVTGLAICQGSSEMLRAAADDERIKVLATVAGHCRDRTGDVEWLGGEEQLAQRRARGEQAKAKYEQTGQLDYEPAIDPANTEVAMPGKFVWDWYHTWADQGIYENQYAVMSDADLLAYESLSAAQRLQTPYLMIHSDNCFLPPAAQRHFEAVPTSEKKLLWEGQTQHFQYYDDPAVIDPAVQHVADWFRTHLREQA